MIKDHGECGRLSSSSCPRDGHIFPSFVRNGEYGHDGEGGVLVGGDFSSLMESTSCSLTSRREAIMRSAGTMVGGGVGIASILSVAPRGVLAAEDGLASKMSKRDASVLKNSAFNIPPQAQVYPDFMHGEWRVEGKFRGFLFPSKSISKEQITSKADVPGFQKCSIAQTCDVGKESLSYEMKIDEKGFEDRKFNLHEAINSNLGYKAVEEVIYDGPSGNPNRISIAFVKNRTRNAERIELFCNARESELVKAQDESSNKIFVCSEYIRQVTFSLSTEFGVARQVLGNYAHFWTWREQNDSDIITGNLLTAAYLDPNDALFFKEPVKPVAVYSQDLKATRIR